MLTAACRMLGLCLVVLCAATAAHADVIDEDDRVEVPQEYRRLAEGVGLLYNTNASFACTAFCVARDVIATNAHCLIRQRVDAKPVMSKDFRFSLHGPLAGYEESRLTLRAVSDDQPRLSFAAGGFSNGASISSQAGDWAFAKLQFGICEKRELKIGEADIDELTKAGRDKRLFMIGYHGDKMLVEKWLSPDCTVRSPEDRKYFLPSQRREMRRAGVQLPHTCDMTEGASGSPIFLKEPESEDYSVVAINSGSVGHVRYRESANGRSRKVLARNVTNLSVMSTAFARQLERFSGEDLLHDIEDFRQLQALLKEKGYYRSKIDGLYGPGTRAAIVAREKELGLVSLGMPTLSLLRDLELELRPRYILPIDPEAASARFDTSPHP
ncbi:trypsin-like peptidase domain-containing protein [Tepidamorphus sp. 3E244]|uniref:trypsin-like peptidase domain-containing protein n=1 Tax=Tepidamorphus sp. 3E244 TaxID=3385498 RepID=UPI0038FCB615